ncbi:neuroguidin [Patagioenas fasciata]|uniref:neuroguidin n=1 Tax=Patagioenas fasciata TaxID=372321 RepID=UPI003A996254
MRGGGEAGLSTPPSLLLAAAPHPRAPIGRRAFPSAPQRRGRHFAPAPRSYWPRRRIPALPLAGAPFLHPLPLPDWLPPSPHAISTMAEAAALLRALSEQVAAVTAHGRETLRRVRGGRLGTPKGLAVLELRAQGLLQYLGDLGLLLLRKTAGKALRGAEERARLAETRVVLEKLRPLERRLRYHVEKLLRAAATGGRDANDPLSFRPRPTDMAATQEEEEEEATAAKAPGLGGGKRYVPPRLVPVTYDSVGQPPERLRRLRRALSSALIRDLQVELGEGPEEEPGGGARPSPALTHRTRLEESLLLRLGRGRKGRDRKGRSPEGRGLHSITHFGDVSALLDPTNEEAPPPKRKRKKPKKGRGFRRR